MALLLPARQRQTASRAAPLTIAVPGIALFRRKQN
jgi:hypothetical protein